MGAAAVLAMATGAAAQDAPASDTSVSLSTGLDYTSGHYGSARATNILVALSSCCCDRARGSSYDADEADRNDSDEFVDTY